MPFIPPIPPPAKYKEAAITFSTSTGHDHDGTDSKLLNITPPSATKQVINILKDLDTDPTGDTTGPVSALTGLSGWHQAASVSIRTDVSVTTTPQACPACLDLYMDVNTGTTHGAAGTLMCKAWMDINNSPGAGEEYATYWGLMRPVSGNGHAGMFGQDLLMFKEAGKVDGMMVGSEVVFSNAPAPDAHMNAGFVAYSGDTTADWITVEARRQRYANMVMGDAGWTYGFYHQDIDNSAVFWTDQFGHIGAKAALPGKTHLDGAHNNSVTTITVDSTSGFVDPGGDANSPEILVITKDDGTVTEERIAYTGSTATTFTGCTRGADGTSALAWADGDYVVARTRFTNIVTGQTLSSEFHLGETANGGGFLASIAPGHCALTAGAELINGAWKARSTAASLISCSDGDIDIYQNASLTDGDNYTATFRHKFDINGNFGVGTGVFGTSAAKVLAIANGTEPSSGVANMIQIYSKDVSASAECFIKDEGGTATQQTPHNFELFEPDPSYDMPWSYYSQNAYMGKEIGVDMYGAIKAIEEISGKKFIYVNDLPTEEKRDWKADQKEQVKQINKEIARAKRLGYKPPEEYKEKEPPKWMKERGV